MAAGRGAFKALAGAYPARERPASGLVHPAPHPEACSRGRGRRRRLRLGGRRSGSGGADSAPGSLGWLSCALPSRARTHAGGSAMARAPGRGGWAWGRRMALPE